VAGLLEKAIKGLNKGNISNKVKPIRTKKKSAKKKAAPKNRNKPGPKITTSKAKAAAQKRAIQKRVDARIKSIKNKKKKG